MTSPEDKIARKAAEMPSKYRRTYRKAMTGRSLRAATNAFCLECCGWIAQEVRRCTDQACPFHRYRPHQKKDEGDDA